MLLQCFERSGSALDGAPGGVFQAEHRVHAQRPAARVEQHPGRACDRADADKQRPEQQDARAVRYLECVCICVLSIAAYSSESI